MVNSMTEYCDPSAILDEIEQTGKLVEARLTEQLAGPWAGWGLPCECLCDVGLRIRPYLFRISVEAGGIAFDEVIAVAAGIELIQLSTLVVDDVLDKSPLRNGHPSVFSTSGAEHAISLGAIMFSAGLSLVADGLSTGRALTRQIKAMTTLCDVHANIYAGQIQDMQLEGKVGATEAEYLEMISKTTATFIQAPLVVGAIVSGMNEGTVTGLGQIGHAMGIAYQIRDDVLDLVRDSECTGKPVAGDLRQGKMRLPVIRALSQLTSGARRRLGELIAERPLPVSALAEAIALVKETDAVSYCIDKVRHHCDMARTALDALGVDVEAKARLRVLVHLVAS